jgi:hypothetical protein
MPIIMRPNDDVNVSVSFYRYPHPSKVLSGTVYGTEGQLVGTMRPETEADRQLRLKNLNDIRRG